jgi:hypothetical protein
MKLRSSFYSLITGIVLVLIHSCAADEGPFIQIPDIPDTSEVLYSTDIQPLFNSSCISCHSDNHPKLNLSACCSYIELTTTGFSASYVDTATPKNSRLYKHLAGELSVMPPSEKLPDYQINTVLKWIEQGAKNN